MKSRVKILNFFAKGIGVLVVFLCFSNLKLFGQVTFTSSPSTILIDFDNSLAGVNNGAFNPGASVGVIATTNPNPGQLDSDAWHFVNDDAVATTVATFGAASITGGRSDAYSTTPGGVANAAPSGGWYGYNINGNRALGWKPQPTFATPGMITLRLLNNTGNTINNIVVSYRVITRNNTPNSNRVRFYHSSDNNTYILDAGQDVVSGNAPPAASINVLGTNVLTTQGPLGGRLVEITHLADANSAMNLGDVVFLNGSVLDPNLKNVSGYITAMTSTTTTIEIDPNINANNDTYGPGGQFTTVPAVSTIRTISISVNVANGEYYYLRWFLDSDTATPGADEVAIDDIAITVNPRGVPLYSTGVSTVIDFDATLQNVNNGAFNAGGGSNNSPNTWGNQGATMGGYLDSNAWSIAYNVSSNASASFGGSFGNGLGVFSNTFPTNSGWCAFEIADPNGLGGATRTLGWKPRRGNGSHVNNLGNGTNITLRISNLTGVTLQDYRISFVVWHRNSTNLQNRIEAFVSWDNNGTYTPVPNTNHTTPGPADNSPAWVGTLYTFTARSVLTTLSTPPGEFFFLRFRLTFLGGGNGLGDEMAIDDITIIPSPLPINSSNPNRDLVWTYDGFDYYITTNSVANYKNISTLVGDFSISTINLHGITTDGAARYRTTNGYASLGWASDWFAGDDPNAAISTFVVTPGKEAGGIIPKPTIPITSASQQRSLVNSGMYVEALGAGRIGRRLQTSTAGFAFQYTAMGIDNYTPCVVRDANCPYISPLRINHGTLQDTRSVTHIRVNQNQGVGMHRRWSHTKNVVYGARGSTVWVGVMLRKNLNNNDPVYISLHRNALPYQEIDEVYSINNIGSTIAGNVRAVTLNTNIAPTSAKRFLLVGATVVFNGIPGVPNGSTGTIVDAPSPNQLHIDFGSHNPTGSVGTITLPMLPSIDIGYFGNASNSGGHRYWGIRVGNTVTINPANLNTRITTAQDINPTLAGQPASQTLEERVFDLLVARIDFSFGQTPAVATAGDLNTPQSNYSNSHRIRLYVIRDIARDGVTPNGSAYPVDMNNPSVLNNPSFNPHGYSNTGANFDLFADGSPDANNDYVDDDLDVLANIDLETFVPAATDISFHSVSFVSGGNNSGAFDEFRIGGSFNQAALNSPVVSLIRGLCSANGGSLGSQVYQGGDFGQARCLRADNTRVPEPGISISSFTVGNPTTITLNSSVPSTLSNPDDPTEAILRAGDEIVLTGVGGTLGNAINNVPLLVTSRPNDNTVVVNFNSTGLAGGGGIISSVNGCEGTTTSTSTTGTRENYLLTSNDSWSSQITEDFLGNQWTGGAPQDHPSYRQNLAGDTYALMGSLPASHNSRNNVMRAGGNKQLYPGGPLNRTISGGAYGYQLGNHNNPNDNNYTLATQNRGQFGPAWIPYYDNSPDKNGYLMNINAAYARTKFFDQTITGLCADTQYEFSVDIINVLRPIRAITSVNPYSVSYLDPLSEEAPVATAWCNTYLEPGCGQFSTGGITGNTIGLGSVTRGGTGSQGHMSGNGTGSGWYNFRYTINPEIEFALNDAVVYTVPNSIPISKKWHRVGLTFVTKANLASAINLSVKNLAPGGGGNDLAIDNVSFRACGSYSTLLDLSTICSTAPNFSQKGRIYVQIGKAGASYSNSVVRFQKWTPFPHPISRLITGAAFGTPTTLNIITAPGYDIPFNVDGGTEVTLYDLPGIVANGTTATVSSVGASSVVLNLTTNGAYTPNTGVLQISALLAPAVANIQNSGTFTKINFNAPANGVLDNLKIGMLVSISGITGALSCLNGQSGVILNKDNTGIVVNIPFCTVAGSYTITQGRFALMYGSDDTNNNGIADENEWVNIDFNPYDGGNYTSVSVNDQGTYYQAPCIGASCLGIPTTPVAINRDVTPYNVFYSNGTALRALFAGNQANLDEPSGKCRFVVPGFSINCSILSAGGALLRAERRLNGILLTWRAVQEKNSTRYILERSDDKMNFYPIASYEATGNLEYQHLDAVPFYGTNYYRVKVLESDGSYIYTNVVSIDWKEGNGVLIYPNPASSEVYVYFAKDYDGDEVSIRLLNNMGLLVKDKAYTLSRGQKQLTIPLYELANGLYLLEIKVGAYDKIVHKLVVKK